MSSTDEDKFTPLCNLLHTTHCEHADLTVEQAGDILHCGANPMVCDHSRRIALAVFAWLGASTGDAMLDATVDQIGAAMRDGRGAFDPDPDGELDDGEAGGGDP